MRTLYPGKFRHDQLMLTTVLYALSDEVRLAIVSELAYGGERACGEFHIEKPKSSLSHHFRVLREAGVITTRREGTTLINILCREELDAQFPGLLDAVLSASYHKETI
ncbi:transcriptional regulator [Reticulibacter mediterranei]|uniref:Transcriptional regulator n=1 Tax=Reticulibacter mediterranei TaxID=2778369 RepID=A0A8J3J096_9CHLR|nr:helix-turn-helix domain-containing protein [Reticulibacter mediterranei]GHO99987.1 transcriptional regulator [Reticulibacter mediterranei]